MNKETLLSKPYQHADNAFLDAQTVANELNESFNIIYTSGIGYEVVTKDFIIDRNYYHGFGGKKMFFELFTTVNPESTIK